MATQATGPASGYRSDIDGLRAVAVLSVVLFHAGVPGFSGGFVGVDIFFVISGYLITGIIAREIREGRFSILTFYERRTRRIFPALFAMLTASVLAAAVIELPHEFEEFGKSLAAATLFVSNMFFWQTAGYFDGPAHLKPLLHTWSLAVEEQFYIVFPLLLLALARWGKGRWVPWLVALTALSLALSAWAVSAKPNAAFYLLPSRFWELMVGALLALGAVPALPHGKCRAGAGMLGLLMIALSVVFYSSATAFPGLAALLPCLGAALVIHAGSGGDTAYRAARLLSLKPMVFIGLISYSLYLWHWPLLAFARQASGQALSPLETAAIVAASGLLAVLSWRYIETPFRERRAAATAPVLFRAASAAMAATLIVAVFAAGSSGWPSRFDGYARPAIAGLDEMRLAACFLKDDQPPDAWAGVEACRSGNSEGPLIVLWGDSFAAHLAPGLASEAAAYSVVQVTAGGCPPLPGLSLANRPHCQAFNDKALALIGSLKPAAVLVSARWEAYLPRLAAMKGVAASLQRIQDLGPRVLVVADSPTFDFEHPYDFVYRKSRDWAAPPASSAFQAARLPSAATPDNAITVFEPREVLCHHGRCPLKSGGAYLYFDGGHYSVEGSRLIARALLPRLESAAAAGATKAAAAAKRPAEAHHLN